MTLLKPALRKSHIDILMQLALTSRSVDGIMYAIPQNGVILITDAGRDGNSAALLSSVKITDQVPRCMAANWQGRHWATHTHAYVHRHTAIPTHTDITQPHTPAHIRPHTHTHTWALECAHVHIHLV